MTEELFSLLTWFVDYSNFYSILIVLSCFTSMVVFILRLNNDNIAWLGRRPSASVIIPRQSMRPVTNPFIVSVRNLEKTSLTDVFTISVTSCKTPWSCALLWGCDITNLHGYLQRSSHDIVDDVHLETLPRSISLAARYHHFDQDCYEIEASCPDELPLTDGLCVSPRKSYPLVVMAVVSPDIATCANTEQEVVCAVSPIHLRDRNTCQLPSQMLQQYIKVNTGQVCHLQPLYMVTAETDTGTAYNECTVRQTTDLPTHSTSQSEPSDHLDENIPCESQIAQHVSSISDNETIQDVAVDDSVSPASILECVVCQSASITHVLLPCRHTCVCNRCFTQLDKCPICRGEIQAYFTLRELSVEEMRVQCNGGDTGRCVQPVPWYITWEGINQRLNELFGFA